MVVLVYERKEEWGFIELIDEVATLADAEEKYPDKILLEEGENDLQNQCSKIR